MAQKFYTESGFPCIRGVIDGTHIESRYPMSLEDPHACFNRKGFFSIYVLARLRLCKRDQVVDIKVPRISP